MDKDVTDLTITLANNSEISVEQLCRNILEKAIQEGLVVLSDAFTVQHAQEFSSGDLCGLANYVNDLL